MSILKKVVVVDDDEKVIAQVNAALTREGFRVFGADEGLKALELVRTENPEILITDILQPGLDGAQLCRTVSNDPNLENTRIIVISGVYNESMFRLQMNCRFDVFLEKPFSSSRLTSIVKELVGN